MKVDKSWGVYLWQENRYWVDPNIFFLLKEDNKLKILKQQTITEGFLEVEVSFSKRNDGRYILHFQQGKGSYLLYYQFGLKQKVARYILREIFKERFSVQKKSFKCKFLLCIQGVFPDNYFFVLRLIKDQRVIEFVFKPHSQEQAVAWLERTMENQIVKDVIWLEDKDYQNYSWEIHHYQDSTNYKLVLAKYIILPKQGLIKKPPPVWLGPNISSDERFLDSCLAINSYSKWRKSFLEKLNFRKT